MILAVPSRVYETSLGPTPRGDDNSKFLHFEDVYGKETEEIFRPTYVENLDKDNKSLLVKKKSKGSYFVQRLLEIAGNLWRQEVMENQEKCDIATHGNDLFSM